MDYWISTKWLAQGTFQEVQKRVTIRIGNYKAAPGNCSQAKGGKNLSALLQEHCNCNFALMPCDMPLQGTTDILVEFLPLFPLVGIDCGELWASGRLWVSGRLWGEGCLHFAGPGVGRPGCTVKNVDGCSSQIRFFLLLGILKPQHLRTNVPRKLAKIALSECSKAS